jgi:hypothetical protein
MHNKNGAISGAAAGILLSIDKRLYDIAPGAPGLVADCGTVVSYKG